MRARPFGSRTITWYMRRSGASFAISANGTAITAAGRAASSSLVTVIVTPAADATEDSAAAATHRQVPLIADPPCLGRIYGIAMFGSTTAQKAHFGSTFVSNSSGRLVRFTGKVLSQVLASVTPHSVIEVTLGRLKALNSARYSRAWSESTVWGGLAP